MRKLKVNLKINYNETKPNGTPRKILDTSIAKKYGWKSKISLNEGFKLTFNDFIKKIG